MENHLAVSETFYSIQGEGSTMGLPSVFLRLTGCNLLCHSKTWICDTIEVWQKGKTKPFHEVLSDELLSTLKTGRVHLVITGGEPMLQKENVVRYLNWLHEKDIYPFVEVETNGTFLPHNEMRPQSMVNQWNVSFKLTNSGEPYNKRINDVALRWFNNRPHAFFKLVVATEADVIEILTDYAINPQKVILMPAGATQDELNITRPEVVRLAKEFGMRYCDRLHIVIWNQKTGV